MPAEAKPGSRVAITGSSGMLGSALAESLEADGHEVLRLVRRAPRETGEVEWDPVLGLKQPEELEGCDALVTLHGANIAGGRWTRARKRLLVASRVGGLEALASSLKELENRPRVLISASGVGIYGAHPEGEVDESAAHGTGFLAELAASWEEAAMQLGTSLGSRVAILRFGVVLSPHGGALAKMLPIYRLGLGGVIADGRASMSWIALDDAVAAIRFLLSGNHEGCFNAVSPSAVTQRQFTKALGRVLARPTLFPVPSTVLRVVFGEMARETLLANQRVAPARLLEAAFHFRFPDLETALRHLLEPALR